MRWLDRVSLLIVVIVAVPLALAPFIPEPHLWQKAKMLLAGELTQVVDWLDVLMHGVPSLLLLLKLGRMAKQKCARASQ